MHLKSIHIIKEEKKKIRKDEKEEKIKQLIVLINEITIIIKNIINRQTPK